jgi:3-(3-hydroxy-phenyl)propionate hydroxylase
LDGETKADMVKAEKIQELISPWLNPNEYEIIRAAVYRFHSLLTQKFKYPLANIGYGYFF